MIIVLSQLGHKRIEIYGLGGELSMAILNQLEAISFPF